MSVGKLAPGQESYYLHSVARGLEDYYLGGGEAPGRWLGTGADMLGLAGEVAGAALVAVLDDRDPATGTRLGCATNRRTPGFDLTFCAPKSVSVLFGLGDPDTAAEVREAWEAASTWERPLALYGFTSYTLAQ